MKGQRLPLHIVTMWHPEYWLAVSFQKLASLPSIKRARDELERRRHDAATSRKLPSFQEVYHDRPVINLGQPADNALRRHWVLRDDKLLLCLTDLDVRLIDTEERGTQARYKFEFRPDWVAEENQLGPEEIQTILNNLRVAKQLSIRQCWRNPVTSRIGSSSGTLLPLEVPAEIAPEVANLVLGPFDKKDSIKGKANLEFEKIGKVWWLILGD